MRISIYNPNSNPAVHKEEPVCVLIIKLKRIEAKFMNKHCGETSRPEATVAGEVIVVGGLQWSLRQRSLSSVDGWWWRRRMWYKSIYLVDGLWFSVCEREWLKNNLRLCRIAYKTRQFRVWIYLVLRRTSSTYSGGSICDYVTEWDGLQKKQ